MTPTPDRVGLTSADVARVDSALASAERYSGVELLVVVVARPDGDRASWLQRWLGSDQGIDLDAVADSVLHDRRRRQSTRPWGLVLCVEPSGGASVHAEPEVVEALAPDTLTTLQQRLRDRVVDGDLASALVGTLEELRPRLADALPRPLRAASEEPHRLVVV